MISTRASNAEPADRDPTVVLAADEAFAMALATTLRSVLDNLAPERRLRIFVLDAGLQAETRQRVLRSLPSGRFDLEWLAVDASVLAGLPIPGHVNLVGYYRILIPRVLPADVRRVIYLDSDLIIRADLGRLWDTDLAGQLCLAAQDCSAPYMDSSQALPNYAACAPYLGSCQPVPNFRELGLSSTAPYFNSGVLSIDLDGWRAHDMPRRMLACLEDHRQHVLFWDQYALNVALAGLWGPLDLRWNQGLHFFLYPAWQASPFDRQTFDQARGDPYIVHYTTRYKPWGAYCPHPLRHEFFTHLDRTVWAGWRPPRLKVIWELVKSQERALRRGRKWLGKQARQWFARA